ncbi:MAG: TPM domain-containing protein [Pseudomonadota bacterium]|nr:TPM domain-containing protein [Pseudomonadota bacterium]
MFLSPAEAAAIDASIARVEGRTGVQIVAAVIGKADTYAELPWIAFALGVSVAALASVVADALRPDWITAEVALLHTVTSLAAGGASALAAVFVPAYARLFLRPALRDLEVRHYAESLFLRRELFKTRNRNGILILICRFERKVEILADAGFHGRMGEVDWDRIIAAVTPLLREGRSADALHAGLTLLGQVLVAKGFTGGPGSENELPDSPIEERGA